MSSFPVNPRMEDTLISIAGLIISLKSLHLITVQINAYLGEGLGSEGRKRHGEGHRDRKREREGSREGREKTIGWARCFLFP